MPIPTRATLFLLALSPAVSAAQEYSTGESRFGAIAALTLSKFGGQDAEGSKLQFGFAAGGTVTLSLTRNVALEPELLYVLRGSKFSSASGSSSVHIGYLELPVLLILRIPPSKPGGVSPNVYGGVAGGFRIDCRVKASSGSVEVIQTCGNQSEPPPRRLDAGLVFGAGVEIRRIRAGVRYELGMMKIHAGDPPNDIKNRTLFFLVGTSFPSFR